MRASFYGGKKIFGLAMGVTSLCISYIWISYTGFHLTVFDDSIGGVFWVFSGFGIGYFTTRREDVYQNIKLNKKRELKNKSHGKDLTVKNQRELVTGDDGVIFRGGLLFYSSIIIN